MSRMKQRSVSSSVSSSVDFGAAAATMILEQHGSPLEKETSISQPNNPWTRRRKTWLWLATLAGVIGLLHQGESIHRDLRRLAAQNTLEPQPAHFYREQFGPVHRPHHYSVSIRTEVHPFGDAVARAHAPIAPNWSTKPFLGFDNQTGSPAREHTLSLFPRLASLDAFPADQHVNAEDIVFAFATDVARIRKMAPSWKHFLRQGSSCLIVLPPVQRKRHGEVAKILAEHGLSRCKSITSDVDAKSYPRYEHRMLNMPQALLAQDWRTEDDRELHPRWYIVLDDDTHVLDMGILLRELSSRQFTQPNLLCGTSESIGQLRHAGRICYGGAGIIFSQALLQSMVDVLPKCFNKFRNITGGDAMLTACAALAQNTKVEQIMTDVPSLHQCDVQGDVSGVLQSGLSFLTMHHYTTWFELFPAWLNRDRMLAAENLWSAVELVGGDNFLNRYVFNDGQLVLVLGYSITLYSTPLRHDELYSLERTWRTGAHELRWTSRRRWQEHPGLGVEHISGPSKISFFLKKVVNGTMVYESVHRSTISVSLVDWA